VLWQFIPGKFEFSDSEKVVLRLDKKVEGADEVEDVEIVDNGKKEVYYISKFRRTSHSTCYNQTVKVKPGDRVFKGDVIADGPSTELGELALGRNLVIAYMTLEGYGFEDCRFGLRKISKTGIC